MQPTPLQQWLTTHTDGTYAGFLSLSQNGPSSEILADHLKTAQNPETLIKISSINDQAFALLKDHFFCTYWQALLVANKMLPQEPYTAFEIIAGRYFYQEAIAIRGQTKNDEDPTFLDLLNTAAKRYGFLPAKQLLIDVWQYKIYRSITEGPPIQNIEQIIMALEEFASQNIVENGTPGYALRAITHFWIAQYYGHQNSAENATKYYQYVLLDLKKAHDLLPYSQNSIANVLASEHAEKGSNVDFIKWLKSIQEGNYKTIFKTVQDYAGSYLPDPLQDPCLKLSCHQAAKL